MSEKPLEGLLKDKEHWKILPSNLTRKIEICAIADIGIVRSPKTRLFLEGLFWGFKDESKFFVIHRMNEALPISAFLDIESREPIEEAKHRIKEGQKHMRKFPEIVKDVKGQEALVALLKKAWETYGGGTYNRFLTVLLLAEAARAIDTDSAKLKRLRSHHLAEGIQYVLLNEEEEKEE